MGILSFFSKPDMEPDLARFRETPGAVLLDVRTSPEYQSGRIPGSLNLPLHEVHSAPQTIPNKSTPLFVYCQGGVRSRQAVSQLQTMGYTTVFDLGGIDRYRGPVER